MLISQESTLRRAARLLLVCIIVAQLALYVVLPCLPESYEGPAALATHVGSVVSNATDPLWARIGAAVAASERDVTDEVLAFGPALPPEPSSSTEPRPGNDSLPSVSTVDASATAHQPVSTATSFIGAPVAVDCHICVKRRPNFDRLPIGATCDVGQWERRWATWCGAADPENLPYWTRFVNSSAAAFATLADPRAVAMRHEEAGVPGIDDGSAGASDDSLVATEAPLSFAGPASDVAQDVLSSAVFTGGLCFDLHGGPPEPRFGWRPGAAARAGPLLDGDLETRGHFRGQLNEYWGWLRAATLRGPSSPATTTQRCGAAGSIAIVVPLAVKADNLCHVYHRIASARRLLRVKYGPRWRTDLKDRLTLVLPATRTGLDDLKASNAYALYARMIADRVLPIVIAGAGSNSKVCFDTVHVLRLTQGRKRPSDPLPGLNTWFGKRTAHDADDARWWRRSFAELHAPGFQLPAEANRRAPKIVFTIRRRTRRFLNWPAVEAGIVAAAKARGAREVVVLEVAPLSPRQWVEVHADADVLVGPIGSGLHMGLLMPPGAILVEWVMQHGCANYKWGWDNASACDFGGNAVAADQNHLAVFTSKVADGDNLHRKGLWNATFEDAHVPLKAFEQVLDQVFCKLADRNAPCRVAPSEYAYERGWEEPYLAGIPKDKRHPPPRHGPRGPPPRLPGAQRPPFVRPRPPPPPPAPSSTVPPVRATDVEPLRPALLDTNNTATNNDIVNESPVTRRYAEE